WDHERDADRAADELARDVVARPDRTNVEGPARREVGDQPAARRARARVEHAERQVLHVGRQDEPEGEEGAERDEDEHRQGERIAQRRPHLAQEKRPQPAPAHDGGTAAASTRRKTSVISGAATWTSASG